MTGSARNGHAAHLGVAHHLGWAVTVTASSNHRVLDRRRFELIEPGLPEAPFEHGVTGLDTDSAEKLVSEVRVSILRATSASLDQLLSDVAVRIASISVRGWPLDFPDDVNTQRMLPYRYRADSIMYCRALAECAHERGLEVHFFEAKEVEAHATALLGRRAEEVLYGPRTTLGPPWAKDHRMALAATVLASRSR